MHSICLKEYGVIVVAGHLEHGVRVTVEIFFDAFDGGDLTKAYRVGGVLLGEVSLLPMGLYAFEVEALIGHGALETLVDVTEKL